MTFEHGGTALRVELPASGIPEISRTRRRLIEFRAAGSCARAAETWHSISLIERTAECLGKRARADVSQPSRRLSTPRDDRAKRVVYENRATFVRSFVVAVIDYQRRIINRLPGFPAGRGNARGGQRDTRTGRDFSLRGNLAAISRPVRVPISPVLALKSPDKRARFAVLIASASSCSLAGELSHVGRTMLALVGKLGDQRETLNVFYYVF